MATSYLVPTGIASGYWNIGTYTDIDGGTYPPATTSSGDWVNSESSSVQVDLTYDNWNLGTATAIVVHIYGESYGGNPIAVDISLDDGSNYEGSKSVTIDSNPGEGWETTAEWSISETDLNGLRVRIAQPQFIQLYEITVNVTYTVASDTVPGVTLDSPADNSILNNLTLNFTADLTDDVGLDTAIFRLWNGSLDLIDTTITILSGATSIEVGKDLTLSKGNYTWGYEVNDSTSQITIPNNFTLNIQDNSSVIVLDSPVEGLNTTEATQNFTADITDDISVDTVIFRLWKWITDWTIWGTVINIFGGENTSIDMGTNYTLNESGEYLWGYEVNDSEGQVTYSENRTLTLDFVPKNITIFRNVTTNVSVGWIDNEGGIFFPYLKKCHDLSTVCDNEDTIKYKSATGQFCCG